MGRSWLAIIVILQATACSAPGYYVVPSVSVDAVYTDNLFYTSKGKRSDFITRVSPGLEVGHESRNLSWSGRYRFDAEAYARETDLNSANVRQFADMAVEYLPTSRLTLNAAADYTKTDTPFDLSLIPGSTIPGLLVGRAEAWRTAVQLGGNYRISPLLTGFVTFNQAHEKLIGVAESDTSVFEGWFEQRLSAVNTLSYGYIHRRYRFDSSVSPLLGGSVQDSDTPWLGLAHQFNARTLIMARAGPRLDGSSMDPYVLVSLQHRFADGRVTLDYIRDQTTLLGEPGNLELESLHATISRRFGTRLDVHFSPGYAHVSHTNSSVDIYSVGIGAVYKINEAVSLTASYDYNSQKVSAVLGGLNDVSHNMIQVGLRFTYPRREPREPR